MKNDKIKNQYRVNEQIRVREVRVVSEGGSEVMPTRKALDLARQAGEDLVEISPNAQPPVCRIIDYSKFLYQQKKRQKEMKQKQVKQEVKEIRFGPQTDDHDYQFKLKHAIEFLEEGNKVRAVPLPRSQEDSRGKEEPAEARQREARGRSSRGCQGRPGAESCCQRPLCQCQGRRQPAQEAARQHT